MGTFAYVEGYGAFQKKFSPLVVQRAMTLKKVRERVVLCPCCCSDVYAHM